MFGHVGRLPLLGLFGLGWHVVPSPQGPDLLY